MSKSATKEYVMVSRNRYMAMENRLAKGRVLDDFCQTSGYERKHAIKLLNSKAGNRRERAGRKGKYRDDVKLVLKELWLMSDQMCSKLLKPVMGLFLGSYEKHFGQVSDEVHRKVMSVSPATIDRLLRPEKVGVSKWRRRVGRSSTRLKKAGMWMSLVGLRPTGSPTAEDQ